MAVSIVCRGCGTDVPGGRLTCPECGEMLASVSGTVLRGAASTVAPPPAMASPAAETRPPAMASTAAALPSADLDGPAGLAPATPWSSSPATPWSSTPTSSLTLFDDDGFAADDDDGLDALASGSTVDASPTASGVGPPDLAPAEPAWPPAPRPVTAAATPGAYVPPVLQSAGAPAPARAWAGHGDQGPTLPGSAGMVAGAAGVTTPDTASPAAAHATSGGLAGALDPARATEFVGWLAIAGGALAAVGFLLPWSVSVIGAAGVGYFDRWGLAGPGHLLVVVALLGVVAAAVLRDRVPIWVGVGLPGLALGALLIGLVWPYLFGPLGGQLGVTAVALGSALLAAAGAAAIVVDRHERTARDV